ncbi:MAG: dienelactone hydrolase family protein [Chloroflexi bacterium]|nr:dienelactone hydrolase family protein [Chloroflexota bacterium]MCI0647649.1 dienelactone hydrolase family protein [Chloroflexota bacterium]MCI0731135.1 dienelactone hydrolase family protein [Chloroflexota bacterium]
MKTELLPPVESLEALPAPFDYDRGLSLDVQEMGVVAGNDNVSVHEISYAGQAGGRVEAYLVTPAGKGPFAGVIFVHPAPGSKATFLDEAVTLARRGAVGLLIDAPWAQGEAWGRTLGQPESDRRAFTQTVIDLRRAVDLITSRTDVDANRIGYVGHSLGALFGGVLSGVEKRIRAFVLMAGAGSFTDVMVLNVPSLQGPALEEYAQAMAGIDPIAYVGRAAPSALLFQFGQQDEAFPEEKLVGYAEAGSEPKLVKWYEAGHFLNDEAGDDRLDWLSTQLGLTRR